MRVLLDTNVILDVLLDRQPWVAEARQIWQAVDDGRLLAYLSASSITDIYYVATRHKDANRARAAIGICLDTFQVCGIDRTVLERARALCGLDFEGDVQVAAAESLDLEAIVTRDSGGFSGSQIFILTPAQLCARL